MPPTLVDGEHHYASQTSRSPSAATEAVPVAEYKEWPFQGFLKRIRIGDDITYNLEFKLLLISGHLHFPIYPEALDTCPRKEAPVKITIHHNAATYSKIYQAPLYPKKGGLNGHQRRMQYCSRCGTITVRGKISMLPSLTGA